MLPLKITVHRKIAAPSKITADRKKEGARDQLGSQRNSDGNISCIISDCLERRSDEATIEAAGRRLIAPAGASGRDLLVCQIQDELPALILIC